MRSTLSIFLLLVLCCTSPARRRPHWVVEAVPRDRYYLFGKIILRFDKDVFLGSYSSKYDWKGQLMSSFAGVRTNIIKVAPGEIWGWAGGAVAVAINWKLDRATTAGIVAGSGAPADSRIPLAPSTFSLQRLMSKGKQGRCMRRPSSCALPLLGVFAGRQKRDRRSTREGTCPNQST